ncbi:MAG: FtsX-like permease family protein, partial [Actinomycetota bacterium]
MSPGLLVPLGLFVLVFGWIGILAVRRPLLARLAVREAVRRRGQTALVVAGLMVGTATITAALVGGDSVADSSVESFAYRNLGHIDLTVRAADNGYFPRAVADRLAGDATVIAVTDGIAGGVEVFGSDLDRRQGTSGVVLVGFDPRRQAPFGAYGLVGGGSTDGTDLGPGEVLISRLLADKLAARVGDRLRFSLESAGAGSPGGPVLPPPELTVAGIALAEPPGSYTLGAVVFAPLDTAEAVIGSRALNVVRISVPGGIRDTEDASRRAGPPIGRSVRALPNGDDFLVSQAKLKEVDNAETASEFIRAMLLGMSALVVAAGSALIVNLIGMLAEERRSRLGVLRALGLKRKRLVGLAVIEGAIYSLAAGVVGVLVGLPAGRLIAERFGTAFAQFAGDDFDFDFHFVLRPRTLVTGFAVGTLLTLLVVWLTARRTANLTITSAIRNLPEPHAEPASRGWSVRIRLAALVVLGVGGVLSTQAPARMAGGLGLILAASMVARGRLGPRLHATVTGLALAGWSFSQVSAIPPDEEAAQFFGVFVLAMLASVFGLTILASAHLRVAERLAGLLGRARRATLRPPLAYLARRPMRTGLTTGVFAVILAMLSLFAVFFVVFQPPYERFSNGYEVRVLSTGASNIELPAGLRADVRESVRLRTLGYVGPFEGEAGFGDSERTLVPLFVVDQTVASEPPVRLDLRADAHATDARAWAAVVAEPGSVITPFGNPGHTITLRGDSGPVELRVVATPAFGLLDGMYLSAETAKPFASAPVGASMLIDARPGVDAIRLARAIEAGLFEQGV